MTLNSCPNCGSEEVQETTISERFPYGTVENAFEATFPVMACAACGFGWRDHRAEEAIDEAMSEMLHGKADEFFSRGEQMALEAEADYYEGKLRGDA